MCCHLYREVSLVVAAGRGVGRRLEERVEERKDQEEEEPKDGGGMGTVAPHWGNQSSEDEQLSDMQVSERTIWELRLKLDKYILSSVSLRIL